MQENKDHEATVVAGSTKKVGELYQASFTITFRMPTAEEAANLSTELPAALNGMTLKTFLFDKVAARESVVIAQAAEQRATKLEQQLAESHQHNQQLTKQMYELNGWAEKAVKHMRAHGILPE